MPVKRDYTKRYEYALQWKPKKSFDRLLREAMAIQQQSRPERARITPTASAPVLPNESALERGKPG